MLNVIEFPSASEAETVPMDVSFSMTVKVSADEIAGALSFTFVR